ncbi:4-hydroxybenzoate octaprenyltransferase [Alteromonas sp. ASW11-36]|uniref:4-hydroxybenzoate octaprenyltransferase n=1 Tax=Alteromonas arenosi TaxID=3055817 RepID=A0ABT7SSU3_9ALTE|nr:4-hydroxybenzoate octaprenyltransferase [Alteromonas sp. ASW11-36]MDM7859261.1 4-hydroxybenzoate octaprenyltransferase [Alteromonas sp. ASW11-36]
MDKKTLTAYWQLMRADKPIGIYLLLWPTFWSVFIAAEGYPSWQIVVIFALGVVVMRSAGCVINDIADRKVDGKVKRTAQRPLARGDVSTKQAMGLFFVLLAIAFALVLQLNIETIYLSFVAVLLASIYPFMKRYTHLPQVVLGAAFSWSIPMAAMAILGELPNWVWGLYAANLCWTIAYDTQYAMVDRDDDILIGVKSTAILFGQYDRVMIASLQILTLAGLVWVGVYLGLSLPYYLGLLVSTILLGRQLFLIRERERDACFQAFLNNHWVGMAVTLGIAMHYWWPIQL